MKNDSADEGKILFLIVSSSANKEKTRENIISHCFFFSKQRKNQISIF